MLEAANQQLHNTAHRRPERWELDYNLNTTALSHEAYLKLAVQKTANSRDG